MNIPGFFHSFSHAKSRIASRLSTAGRWLRRCLKEPLLGRPHAIQFQESEEYRTSQRSYLFIYPTWQTYKKRWKITMFSRWNNFKWAIFYSYVSLPEGIQFLTVPFLISLHIHTAGPSAGEARLIRTCGWEPPCAQDILIRNITIRTCGGKGVQCTGCRTYKIPIYRFWTSYGLMRYSLI